MRIRKNSKMATALFLSSSDDDNLFRSHLCQLNQSPWDIITFSTPSPPPPSPSQVVGSGSFNGYGNGSLTDHAVGAVESIGSLKLAIEAEHVNHKKMEKSEEDQGRASLCCKTDGKQWQCKREVQKKNTMCNYHLAQVKNYNTLAHPSTNAKPSSNTPAAGRTRKPSTASNPNEFYYYAGFGPLWGKKRDMNKREKETVEEKKATLHSSSSEIDDEDDSQDDDNEEVEEEKSANGKKRKRKPIKARSLKDLCEKMG